MADTELRIAMDIVRYLLLEEARFLFNVKGEVEDIGVELERMRDFLERDDVKRDEDEELRHRVTEIRGLADEVEGVLVTFANKVASQKTRGGIKNALKRSACIFNECISRVYVRSEILRIKTKITNCTDSLPRYEMPKGDSSDSTHERHNYLQFEDEFVGKEEDIKQLVSHLVNEENTCRVVSICGMGGLGKTSLAKKCYNHDKVQRHFCCYAWVCISLEWKTTYVLQEILVGLIPQNKGEIRKMTDRELFEQIYEIQQKEKCLLVIDDRWSIDAWDCLKQAFPIGKTDTCSKILLTTRNREVALHADPSGFVYEPRGLNEKESWELLQRKAFRRRDIGTEFIIEPRMVELGKEMVSRCRGLPLAVKVLGGILIMKQSYTEWETVYQDLNRYLMTGIGREQGMVIGVLDLSYYNLSYQLKQCFLFFGKLPSDFEIKATRIYHLWIAEGIVSVDHQVEGEGMMDVAERYLGELAQRCMVEVGRKEVPTRRRIKNCTLHDVMIDLCSSKLRSNSAIKQRRTIYYNSDQFDDGTDSLLELAEQILSRQVRSLVVCRGREDFWVNLNNFQLLRVLDLEGLEMNGENLPESIGNLVELRYLSLRCTSSSLVVWELPSSISNLRYLQILDLRTAVHPLLVPDVLCKLQRLTHLYLPTRIELDREKRSKLRLGGLSNLETLVNFNSNYCHVEGLEKLSKLRKLKAEFWEGFEHMRDLVNTMTSEKTLFKESKLKIMGFRFHSKRELETLNKLFGCHHLCKLDLQGPISTLPGHNHFSQFLTDLNLWESRLKEDPMPTLEKLPSLFSLHIGRDVFMGSEMVCSLTGFPQLKTLVLAHLPNLENWEVNEGAFPKLSRVEIHSCKKLAKIPDGLKFVTTIDEICIHDMSEDFKLKNRPKFEKGKEVEDIQKVRHNPTIKFYNTFDSTRMERAGTKKNGEDRISEVPESSQTISFRDGIMGNDGHDRVQNFWLGPFPKDMFSKLSSELQAAKIETMEKEMELWKKKVQILENHMLSHMTDLPLDAHADSRQDPEATSAHQLRPAPEV